MKKLVFLVILVSFFMIVFCQDGYTAVFTDADVKQSKAPTIKSASKLTEPKKEGYTRAIEIQLSGATSEYADQLYGRIGYQYNSPTGELYIRGSYSRTATNSGSSKSYVTTSRLDARTEHTKSQKAYNTWMAVMNRRDRSQIKIDEESGFHLLYYGFGKRMDLRNRGDIGIGLLDMYDDSSRMKPAVVCSLIVSKPLREKFILDSRILAIQPLETLRATKLDSEIGLAYELFQGFSLRLGWTANNLVRPIRGTREWDSVIRLNLSLKKTKSW